MTVTRPLAEKLTLHIETLYASVLAVCHVDDAFFIGLDRMRQTELSRAGSGGAPFAHFLSIRGVFQDPCIRISIGDEDVAVGRESDIGGAAEVVAAGSRLSADGDLQQLLSVRRKLRDHGTGRIRRPHVALTIDAYGVRHRIHALAP